MHIDITTLYKEYYLRMVLYAAKWIKDYQLAEEIASDALSTLNKQSGNFETKFSMKCWLFTYIKFKCINITKKKDKEKKRVLTLSSWYIDEYLDETKTTSELDHYAIQCEVVYKIFEEIEKLSPKNRIVFELAYIEDNTLDEISKKMNLKKQTVKNHLTTAIKQLRIKFNPRAASEIIYATHTMHQPKYKKPHVAPTQG